MLMTLGSEKVELFENSLESKSLYYKSINPFTPKSDQCQISSAASPVILHRTV